MPRKILPLLSIVIGACLVTVAHAPAAEPTTRPAPGAGGPILLERAREMLSQLKLSDEQKNKVEAVFKKAQQDLQELRSNAEAMDPRERMERMRDFMQTLRQNLSDVLTPEQREIFDKKFEEARQNFRRRNFGPGSQPGAAPTTRPGGGGPDGRGPAALGERLRENLQKLDLSDEQKTKIKSLFDDLKAKGEELRGQLQSGGEEARDKMRQLFEQTREKLGDILTDEQRAKLRELMSREPGRVGPDRAKARSDRGDTMMMDESRPKKSEISNSKSQISDSKIPAGPSPGEPAPELTLKKLDGSSLQLSSLAGRVIVLEFGSYSCPAFRNRAPAMEKLKNDLGPRAQLYVVYAREAHATGEWEVDRNKDEGIQVEQPKTFDARKALASTAREKLKITVPMLLDSMDNDAAKTFGAGPNSAIVINRDARIAARQQWFEPAALRRAIDESLNARPTTRPANTLATRPASPTN